MTVEGAELIFYTLPATLVQVGMSTGDGRTWWMCRRRAELVDVEVYTPRPDDPGRDEINRAATETWMVPAGERVELAIFEHTEVDGWGDGEALLSVIAVADGAPDREK